VAAFAAITAAGETVLVATGSSPRAPPIDGLGDVEYYTSEPILEERDLPGSVVVIGGGYVALEWGQILHRVGVDVTLLQRSERVLSGMEGQLGHEIARAFAAEGLFVAAGVRPNSEGIDLEAVGVETDESGAIRVDEHFRTTRPDVYAAGDVVGEPMLETVAAKEGNHAVRNAFGNERATVDYEAVPAVVFTSHEIASVGLTEREYTEEHGTCSCRTVRMRRSRGRKSAGRPTGHLDDELLCRVTSDRLVAGGPRSPPNRHQELLVRPVPPLRPFPPRSQS